MKAFAVLAIAVAALPCGHTHAASSRKPVLQIITQANPAFPYQLVQRGILDGEAEAFVSISPEGGIDDWLVTAYTDPAFEKMAAEILPDLECRFASGQKRAGPTRVKLRFHFETRGVVINHSVNDTIDRLITSMTSVRRIEKLGTPRQLDQMLTAQHTVAPFYPETLRDAAGTRVTLEFLIDENGRVRMPVLHAGEDRVFANAAANALLDWQFNPPTRDGQPVIVSARQEFVLPPK